MTIQRWAVTQHEGRTATEPALRRARALPLEKAIAQVQARLRLNRDDSAAYAQLGLLLLQQVRLTGDASGYLRAGEALDEALARDPDQVDALMGKGILALALHDFAGAREWAERARAINPYRAELAGILVDAHVELGQYEEARRFAREMVSLRPGLSAYTRISYLRELHGDVQGAIEAMEAAVEVGAPGEEPVLWALVQLGHLHFNRGDLAKAESAYRAALAQDPTYPYAQGGLARVWAAQGRTAEAIAQYEALAAALPLPEFAIALADLLTASGQHAEARRQIELVRVMQALNASAGMNVDVEMALFNLDHGGDRAQALAQAEAAYRQRPTVFAADGLAWALYRNGRYAEAGARMAEALRLGAQDARLYYHAGMIALAQGDRAGAEAYLRRALAINPYFSPLEAPKANAILAMLAAGEPETPAHGPR